MVTGRDDGDQFLGEQRFEGQGGVARWRAGIRHARHICRLMKQGEIDFPGDEQGEEVRGPFLAQDQFEAGVTRVEARDKRRQLVLGERGERADDDPPACRPGILGQLRRGTGNFGQDPLGMNQERFARWRRTDAATAAVEEFDAEFAFQQRESAAKARAARRRSPRRRG